MAISAQGALLLVLRTMLDLLSAQPSAYGRLNALGRSLAKGGEPKNEALNGWKPLQFYFPILFRRFPQP